jgi:uroporphyrinogen decarboxylase
MIPETDFTTLTQELDIQQFWEEDARCQVFSEGKPRAPLSFSPDDHWLFGFLDVPSTLRYYRDKPYRDQLHRQANHLTLAGVGQAFFNEDTWEHNPKRIENLFGCEFTYTEGATPWLTPVTNDPDEFSRILDRAERTNLRGWALPEPFLAEWETRVAQGMPLPKLGDGSRGPATVMTSILQPETALYWMYDHPDLMRRFRDLLAEKMVEFNRVLRSFSGTSAPGWWITDDNCALFNRRLYAEYCVPVLERVLAEFAPPGARRYQHSDSAMGHLLDFQRGLGINHANYGPEVDAGAIRAALPRALIDGQMPPALLRSGRPEEIRQRLRDDFRKAGPGGGLHITTAGSLSSGTGLGRMRWMMLCVQRDCRYAGG